MNPADIAAELPDALHAQWTALTDSSSRLSSALENGDAEQCAALAADRHRCLVEFFEHFPAAPEKVELRLELLRQLVAANTRLMENGRNQLQQAAMLEAASRHSRKAINAYQDQ